MVSENVPPAYLFNVNTLDTGDLAKTKTNGESSGPMMVADQLLMSSPSGPALQLAGGSLAKSSLSFMMRLTLDILCST